MVEYAAAMTELGGRVMSAIAVGLDLGLDHFSSSAFAQPFWAMRAIHYPAAEAPAAAEELGCGEHTDYGCLTLLIEDSPGVLQARNRAGEWVTLRPEPGALTVNVGDMLQRWTNGLFVSTPHRVLRPARSRVSLPFFFEPSYDAVVEPLERCVELTGGGPKYGAVRYGDHLLAKTSVNFVPRPELE